MRVNNYIFMAILASALVTWIPRILPFLLVKYKGLPAPVTRFLKYLPISIIFALVLSSLVDGKIASSSSNVYKSVADGEMAVGLTYEDPALKLLNDGVDVKVIYPKEGTVFLPGNAAIVKNAKHMENAKKFIDFLLSQEIQDKLGTETTIRPIRKNAKTNKNMKAMTEINIATEDSNYVIKNKSAILKKYNDIFTDIQSKK